MTKREAEEQLSRAGFVYRGTKKHAKWRHPSGITTHVPNHKGDLSDAVVSSIKRAIRQATG